MGRKRKRNEDSIGDPTLLASLVGDPRNVDDCGWLFAVADGMGGHALGDVASRVAIQTLFTTYYATRGAPRQALLDAFRAANKAVFEQGAKAFKDDGGVVPPGLRMGTTLVAAAVVPGRIFACNVGDSRAYQLPPDGILRQISQDHSLVAEEVRSGLLEAKDARQNPFRNVITRALGQSGEVVVDCFEAPWGPGDILLLCTDGLHGVVEDSYIESALTAQPEDAVERLVGAANEAGGPDNVSVVVVREKL